MKPNYSQYTVEQLLDVQRNIDRERFPERAAEIDALLKNPNSLEHARNIQLQCDDKLKSQRKRTYQLCVNSLPVFIGVFVGLTGSNMSHADTEFLIYNIPVHYVIACTLILFGLLRLYRFFRQRAA